MAAGWNHVAPRWFTELHPLRRTPVNSILFVASLVMGLILLSLLGVREQESQQLLTMASIVHYAIAYAALFALPLAGSAALRSRLPAWLKVAAGGGLFSSLVALSISLYPIVDVVSRAAFAGKIAAVVVVSNIAGVGIYRMGKG